VWLHRARKPNEGLPRGAAAPVENERLTTLARRLAAAGKQVDELSSERLEGDRPAPWKDTLAEVHLVARRSALIEALPTTAGHTASAS